MNISYQNAIMHVEKFAVEQFLLLFLDMPEVTENGRRTYKSYSIEAAFSLGMGIFALLRRLDIRRRLTEEFDESTNHRYIHKVITISMAQTDAINILKKGQRETYCSTTCCKNA